jgi:hypothetical protein
LDAALPAADGGGGDGGGGLDVDDVLAVLRGEVAPPPRAAAAAATTGDGAGTFLVCDCVGSLAALCADAAAAAALVRGMAALGTGAPGGVAVLFRVTPETDVDAPAPGHAPVRLSAALLGLCDAVATFRPLATGQSRDVLGRLRVCERLAAVEAAGIWGGGGGGGGGWLPPPPRSSLYRIAEASCALIGVGAVSVDNDDHRADA